MKISSALSAGMMVSLLLTGCISSQYTDAPTPTRFPRSEQQQLQSAAHWNTIAEHFASQIAQDLRNKNTTAALYVEPASGRDFAFADGFRELLTTALVNQGWEVSTRPGNDALKVDVRYSAYRFDNQRAYESYQYGSVTALAAGLWAFTASAIGIADAGASVGISILLGTSMIEGSNALRNETPMGGTQAKVARNPMPKTEIIITASVADNNRIVARRSNVYFTADEDAALYWQRSGTGRGTTLPVKGE